MQIDKMSKINNLKDILSYLSSIDNEYNSTRNIAQKNRIEDRTRCFLNSIEDGIYLKLNNGKASGLCGPSFFQRDLDHCIVNLDRMIKGQPIKDF